MAEDQASDDFQQTFRVERDAHATLDNAALYLEGAGTVAPGLQGRLERHGDRLVVHHGRLRTTISAEQDADGTRVSVHRTGQAPLQETRNILLVVGLGGFLAAWGVTFFREANEGALHPLFSMLLFIGAWVASAAVLFVADRSLERRSESLMLSIEDAVAGDAMLVLRREIDALERSSAVANGLLFYCGGLIVAFIAYAITQDASVITSINQAATLTTMRFVFLFPVLPSVVFGLFYFWSRNKLHNQRLQALQSRQ